MARTRRKTHARTFRVIVDGTVTTFRGPYTTTDPGLLVYHELSRAGRELVRTEDHIIPASLALHDIRCQVLTNGRTYSPAK